jgi:glycosyltransferase involved in cell wall biosynthesis
MGHAISGCSGLASIIVPCWNQLEFTRHCFRALVRHTRQPWELIVVDNGSADGTADYLGGVQDTARVPVTIITNSTNQGFPAAINQGLKEARGEYFVLLNNDVVVTDGWLDQLIGLANAKTGGGHRDAKGNSGGAKEAGDASPSEIEVFNEVGDTHPRPPLSTGGKKAAAGDSARGIGLVGPMSNYAAPPQLVEYVPYRNLEQVHQFARSWRDRLRGQWFSVPKLSGFCLLMRRVVYEAIGGLDEQFGIGFFEDDDLAERARRAGFELAVAHDLFVHHFGSRAFAGSGIDSEKLLTENEHRFAAKWGLTESRGRRVVLRPFTVSRDETLREVTMPPKRESGLPDPSLKDRQVGKESPVASGAAKPDEGASVPGQPAPTRRRTRTVSLTMIVRDEAANLPRCLQSVSGLFDEIVVLDTGSTDSTVDIALSFGAQVSRFAWIDDFAAARNAALVRATGDYLFWLDADDVVETPQREKLQALFDGLKAGDDAAYVVRCACDPGADGSVGTTVVDHVRLFPRRKGIRWSYRVHEQILPALKRANVPVRWTDIVLRHTGYADPALRARKIERDLRILHDELTSRPDDPFVLFNLGCLAEERRDWREALEYLTKSLAHSAPTDSIVRKLYALIARCHQMLCEPQQALAACATGLALDSCDAELLFREGMVRRLIKDNDGAERCWRRILTLKRPERFCSVEQGIFGHVTLRNLAKLIQERGDAEQAVSLWRAVLAECPDDPEALAMLERLKPRDGSS